MVPLLSRARRDACRQFDAETAEQEAFKHWLLVQLGLSGAAWAILAAGLRYIV